MTKRTHPHDRRAIRPFRLWDARGKKDLRYRYYRWPQNAHDGALKEVRWASIGTTIEVYNRRNGTLIGQYSKVRNGVQFHRVRKDW